MPIKTLTTASRILYRHVCQAGFDPGRWAGLFHRGWSLLREGQVRALLERSIPRDGLYRDYAKWIELHDRFGEADVEALDRAISAMPGQPEITLALVPSGISDQTLMATLDSILAQRYARWRLIPILPDSCSETTRAILAAYRAREPRIRAPGNAADCLANSISGDWWLLSDGRAVLPAYALYCYAQEIMSHPDCDLLYADEDEMDGQGVRHSPDFKPDWNPDLLTSRDYLGGTFMARVARLAEVGGIDWHRPLWTWDAALRVTRGLDAARIRHLPHVLGHCLEPARVAPEAARALLVEYWRNQGRDVTIDCSSGRVRQPVPTPPPRVTIIIPTRDHPDLLRRCIDSARHLTRYPAYDLIVVDNQCQTPAALALLAEVADMEGVEVIAYDAPFNFAAINNLAARRARGEILVLMNDDIEVIDPDWLTELVGQASRPGVGAVGAKLLYPDRSIQHAGIVFCDEGVPRHVFLRHPADYSGPHDRARLLQNYQAVTGACLAVSREKYLEVGGMDEAYAVTCNDIDFCLRLERRGYRNVWTPFAELIHHESATRGFDNTPEQVRRHAEELDRLLQVWPDRIGANGAYNPNLSLRGKCFSLAYPPRTEKPWRQPAAFGAPAIARAGKRIVALMAVRNEAPYLARCLGHLRAQGVEVCLIDNESTDASLEITKGFLGKGVFRIEHQPYVGHFDLVEQLSIKERLAEEIEADWFIHQDADEILETPWPGMTLREGLSEVERLGYEAVNFEEFVFPPTREGDVGEEVDYVATMRHYYFFEPSKLRLLRAWKKPSERVNLVTHAGHQVHFGKRSIYPEYFVLRHYIALSHAHLLNKYGRERVYSRREVEERKWHGPRARFAPDRVRLPSRAELRDLDVDGWSRSSPLTVHPFFGE